MSEPTPPDPIEEYLRAIEAIPSLTSNEERELLIAAKSGDDDGRAKRRLIEAHLRVVVQIAHQNEGRGMRFLNLVEEGNLGLIRVVELFDPSTGSSDRSRSSRSTRPSRTRSAELDRSANDALVARGVTWLR